MPFYCINLKTLKAVICPWEVLEICLTEVVRTKFLGSLVGTSPSTILSLVLRKSSKNLCES